MKIHGSVRDIEEEMHLEEQLSGISGRRRPFPGIPHSERRKMR